MGILRDACRFLVLYKGSLRVLGLRLRALELRVVGFGASGVAVFKGLGVRAFGRHRTRFSAPLGLQI